MASFSAPSSQSKNNLPSFNITYLLMIILFLLVASSCAAAARPGGVVTLMVEGHNKASMEPETIVNPHRRFHKTGILYEGRTYGFLPKGVPMPPSAPSKKHNSAQN